MKQVRCANFFLVVVLFLFFDVKSVNSILIENQNFTRIETSTGWLDGQIVEKSDVIYYSFKGIPYAEPPVGKLRFQAPIPHKKWSGVRKAFNHGNFCLNRFGGFGIFSASGGSEDCLFLNVYTPSMIGNKAVMFWVHGGAFMSGNGDSSFFGPEHLIKEDIVLVTVNYRLSAFGFFSTGDENAPGNQGLKDIVLALKWVKENIKNFGGDPSKVTVFGESAGAMAIDYILMSEMDEELFSKAIMQSNSALSPCCFQPDPKAQADKLAQRLNLTYKDTKDLVEKLTEIDFQKIVNVESRLEEMGIPFGMKPFEFVPTVEPKGTKNAIITEPPILRMLKGNYKKIPLIIGNTNFEAMFLAVFLSSSPELVKLVNSNPAFILPISFEMSPVSPNSAEVIKDLQKLYFNDKITGTPEEWLQFLTDELFRTTQNRVANFHANISNSPIYYYEFAFDGSLNIFKQSLGLHKFMGASHTDELLYLFEAESNGLHADERSRLMRTKMINMWTNFAKYGNPTPKKTSLITEIWKPYTTSEENYLVIDEVLENRQAPPRMNFVRDLYLKYTGHY